MTEGLFLKAVTKFLAGVLGVGALIFLPAWTLHYPQGWLLMAILFIPMFLAGLVLLKADPALLKKRLNAKEEQAEQREVILLSGLMFIASFLLAGLSFRFGWLVLPMWASEAAALSELSAASALADSALALSVLSAASALADCALADSAG